jgi:hypothetical protein
MGHNSSHKNKRGSGVRDRGNRTPYINPNPTKNVRGAHMSADPPKKEIETKDVKPKPKQVPETPEPPAKTEPYNKKPSTKQVSKGNFGALRYPQEAIAKGQDFIKFTIVKYQRAGLTQGPLKGASLGTILLPIPSQINDNNSVNFGSSSMNNLQAQGVQSAIQLMGADFSGAGASIKGIVDTLNNNKQAITQGLAAQAVNVFGGNITLEQVMARSNGTVINPNMELLFSGPGLRQFKFSFKFTPRFKKESDEVKSIIKAFKRNMAPQGSGRDLLGTPNIFQIQYMQGAKEHSFLNKFKLCALTNMSVNYTGDGVHATYIDGTPISMQMDLSFSELTPIYNEDYGDYGAKDEGVGY